MDQHDGSRGSGQAPAKDFLALTHGQEWVNFYESFDKLVQDHLSRSSDLLRRAMSLPEVADREVAQVRAEMEGKLAAERERSHDLLTRLHDEISVSHAQVAGLAENVQAVTDQLAGLNQRVVDAIATLDLPLAAPMAESPAPAIDAVADAAPALNGTVEAFDWSVHEAESAPADVADTASADFEPRAEAVAEPAAEDWSAQAEPSVADWPAATADELSEPEPAVRFDAETDLDLTALAEAETEASDESSSEDAQAGSGTGLLNGDAVAAGGDRPRPHWLSVTRIGSRP
jgi:hypothetical protein